jgi:hypothetical protein
MVTYKLLKGGIENKEYGVLRDNGDGTMTSFLFDPANTDYREYLKWLEEGNAPIGADTPIPSDSVADDNN